MSSTATTSERTLSDADVEAVAERLYARITEDFYRDLGKGLFAMVKKAAIAFLIAVAAYGAMGGIPNHVQVVK